MSTNVRFPFPFQANPIHFINSLEGNNYPWDFQYWQVELEALSPITVIFWLVGIKTSEEKSLVCRFQSCQTSSLRSEPPHHALWGLRRYDNSCSIGSGKLQKSVPSLGGVVSLYSFLKVSTIPSEWERGGGRLSKVQNTEVVGEEKMEEQSPVRSLHSVIKVPGCLYFRYFMLLHCTKFAIESTNG